MNMRNETCVETQTSKVPTRVAFLFISILCPQLKKNLRTGNVKIERLGIVSIQNGESANSFIYFTIFSVLSPEVVI